MASDSLLKALLDKKISIESLNNIRKEFIQLPLKESKVFQQNVRKLETAAKNLNANELNLRKALGFWVLQKYGKALKTLEGYTGENNLAVYVITDCLLNTEWLTKAGEMLEKLTAEKNRSGSYIRLLKLKVQLLTDDAEKAKKDILSELKKQPKDTDLLFLKGMAEEMLHDYESAIETYSNISENDPLHFESAYRLAYVHDLRGNEDESLQAYLKCLDKGVFYRNAYLNLGIIYEDRNDIKKAIKCYKKILAHDPSDRIARIYLRNAEATIGMYYDEKHAKEMEKIEQLLEIPVSDFELSVRSRNCLSKMNIRTLGDLVKKTEEELLRYKNFGETSLKEIKDILNSKNLSLGRGKDTSAQNLTEVIVERKTQKPPEGFLDKQISELEISLRSRKCLEKLGIETVQELLEKSEDDLVNVRNFGATSLNEIKQLLEQHGLDLTPSQSI